MTKSSFDSRLEDWQDPDEPIAAAFWERRRQGRAHIATVEDEEVDLGDPEQKRGPGTTSGSKRCEVCGWVKKGVAPVRGSGPLMCDDCYRASGQKGW
jgi:hypothetical protein